MGLRIVFCPNCGMQTKVDDEKGVSFCICCGNKIPVRQKNESDDMQFGVPIPNSTEGQPDLKNVRSSAIGKNELEIKLQEVAFYYNLSKERNEPHKALQENPYYYLKAQDLLLELSKSFPNDYRVWWELCKPVDYDCAQDCVDVQGQYKINDEYFNKALDYAELEKKQSLIQQRDRYEHDKLLVKEELKRRQQEAEQEKRKQQLMEEERQRTLAEENAAKEEQKRRIQMEEERKRQQENLERQKRQSEENVVLWEGLSQRDYSRITETYFIMPVPNGQQVIGIFRVISNILYLLSVRVDECKGGLLYKDQTLPIQFGLEGTALKYDNKAIRIRNIPNESAVVRIHGDGEGNLFMNQAALIKDRAYIDKIMKGAKKTLLPFNKVFI